MALKHQDFTYKDWSELPLTLDVSQVMFVLGLSERATYTLLRNKTIPAARVGGSWRVDRDVLHDYVRAR